MKIKENSSRTENRLGAGSPASERTTSDTARERWLQRYGDRMLNVWKTWQGPLGVANDYIAKLKDDLAGLYEDPLKRALIEASY